MTAHSCQFPTPIYFSFQLFIIIIKLATLPCASPSFPGLPLPIASSIPLHLLFAPFLSVSCFSFLLVIYLPHPPCLPLYPSSGTTPTCHSGGPAHLPRLTNICIQQLCRWGVALSGSKRLPSISHCDKQRWQKKVLQYLFRQPKS